MIEITNLSKRFGELTAVDDVSFQVVRGDVLGFLGPNGAGKSTTMKMITGFIAPDVGSVVVGGDDIRLHPVEVKRRIGYLPEGAPLYGDMTVRGFLSFIAEIRGYQGPQRRQRLDRAAELVSLGSVLDQSIGTLSKGFKRRVGLAQAIIHDLLDDFLLVNDDEIRRAIGTLVEKAHTLAEGAGATALAGAIKYPRKVKGKKVAITVSGANITVDQLRQSLDVYQS